LNHPPNLDPITKFEVYALKIIGAVLLVSVVLFHAVKEIVSLVRELKGLF
jgi:uncharacterized membrane protein